MNFVTMSSKECKSHICRFFVKTFSLLSIQYMFELSCKMDKMFLRYSMFFSRRPTRILPQSFTATRFLKIPAPR